MAKFIAHSPNGQAYQCDSLAEVKQVEGGFKFRKAKKRNPRSGLRQQEIDTAIAKLSQAEKLVDVYVATPTTDVGRAGMKAQTALRYALEEVKTIDRSKQNPRKKRNGGCGCAGACGNPHCGPKKRNPRTYSVVIPPVSGSEIGTVWHAPRTVVRGSFSTKAEADAWAKANLRGYPYSLKWHTYSKLGRKVDAATHRNPEGQGEDYNMAAFAGAVERGLLPAHVAPEDYKRGYVEGAQISKKSPLAVAAAMGAFRSTGSQAKAGEMLREMSGKASTSSPIGNPRKRRNPAVWPWERVEQFGGRKAGVEAASAALTNLSLGRKHNESMEAYLKRDASARARFLAVVEYLQKKGAVRSSIAQRYTTRNPFSNDPRYVLVNNPKRNGKPKGKYLAHEKEEEQIFASMLTKLPVGVTMKAGKHRVRKLSKGFVVIDGERLSMKDAAAKLHGR